jgi:hypothetical protein
MTLRDSVVESKITDEERTGFSARLTLALTKAGVSPTPAGLLYGYNPRADGATVTTHAARKWLGGESIPTQEKIHVLARWLKVSASWLRFGEADVAYEAEAIALEAPSSADLVLLQNFHSLTAEERGVVTDLIDVVMRRRRRKAKP